MIRVWIIPTFSAIAPMIDNATATIPQEKPTISPATMLLNSGMIFCAITTVTGWANIVANPIDKKKMIDIIGCV